MASKFQFTFYFYIFFSRKRRLLQLKHKLGCVYCNFLNVASHPFIRSPSVISQNFSSDGDKTPSDSGGGAHSYSSDGIDDGALDLQNLWWIATLSSTAATKMVKLRSTNQDGSLKGKFDPSVNRKKIKSLGKLDSKPTTVTTVFESKVSHLKFDCFSWFKVDFLMFQLVGFFYHILFIYYINK